MTKRKDFFTRKFGLFAKSYKPIKFNTTAELINKAERGVFKIGSALIADTQKCKMNTTWMQSMAKDIAGLIEKKLLPIIVSSGAVAVGRVMMNKKEKPKSLEEKQMLAAVGNIGLFHHWQQYFLEHNILCGMLLISPYDLDDPTSRYNLRLNIDRMLRHGIIPILNENDSVSTFEMRFGDNDTLSAKVSTLVTANYLVLLSDIDCLYDRDPNASANTTKGQKTEAKAIRIVDGVITSEIRKIAGGPTSSEGTGGMKTKINAAEIALNAGIHMIIAKGSNYHPITTLLTSYDARIPIGNRRKATLARKQKSMDEKQVNIEATHTLFKAKQSPLIMHMKTLRTAYIDKPDNKIFVKCENLIKMLKDGGLLLPEHIEKIEGMFHRGDVLAVINFNDDKPVAICLSMHSVGDLRKLSGCKSREEAKERLGYGGRFAVINTSFAYPYDDVMAAYKTD